MSGGNCVNVESEYLEINSKNAWAVLYQEIRSQSNNFDYTLEDSKEPQNRNLNRYRDVLPYDHTRIILKKGQNDYINANIVQMDSANRQYILTQGPLPNTAGHFWQMVWEQNSKAIIMLNKVIEKNQIKCHQYWPVEGLDQTMEFPDVDLKVEYITKTSSTDYTTSTLRLTDTETNESRDILHFHYTTWPDFGVPQSPHAFLRFLAHIRQSGALDESVGPAIVHCSAGIGRSGTFSLVDTCLVLVENEGLNSVNVKDILLEMRRARMGLVQTPDQLKFSYAAIIEGSKHLPLTTDSIGNNDTVTNHNDIMNNINNSLQEDDDEPPPPPPPRSDSLNRNTKADLMACPAAENGGVGNRSNPASIPNHVEEEDLTNANKNDQGGPVGSSSPTSSPDSGNEVRQRRAKRQKELEEKVKAIRQHQQKSEDWQKFK
ncbi:hypothetical protein QAD02_006666, partial [Eretmocerus hayati]